MASLIHKKGNFFLASVLLLCISYEPLKSGRLCVVTPCSVATSCYLAGLSPGRDCPCLAPPPRYRPWPPPCLSRPGKLSRVTTWPLRSACMKVRKKKLFFIFMDLKKISLEDDKKILTIKNIFLYFTKPVLKEPGPLLSQPPSP